MELRLMTAEETLFQGEVTSVHGRAPRGEFEVLPRHGAWVSSIDPCRLTVETGGGADDGETRNTLAFAVHGGLVEVQPDSVLILADTAEAAADIDEERAERARARAEDLLKGRGGAQGVDVERARRALARALARLEVHAAGH